MLYLATVPQRAALKTSTAWQLPPPVKAQMTRVSGPEIPETRLSANPAFQKECVLFMTANALEYAGITYIMEIKPAVARDGALYPQHPTMFYLAPVLLPVHPLLILDQTLL